MDPSSRALIREPHSFLSVDKLKSHHLSTLAWLFRGRRTWGMLLSNLSQTCSDPVVPRIMLASCGQVEAAAWASDLGFPAGG